MGEGLMLPPPAPPTVTSMLAWDPPPIPLLPAVALLLAASYGVGYGCCTGAECLGRGLAP